MSIYWDAVCLQRGLSCETSCFISMRKASVSESAKAAIEATMAIWEKARIPTQRVDSGSTRRMIENFYAYNAKTRKARACLALTLH